MDLSSSLSGLGRSFKLAYKVLLTLAVGTVFISHLTVWLHFRQVDSGLSAAEQLMKQGSLAEADALVSRLEPWSRCHSGRYRTGAILRVRCLARSNQTQAAAEMAETLRLDEGTAVTSGGWSELIREPLVWLQKLSVSQMGGIVAVFSPITRPGAWAGYEALIDELVKRRDEESLETLATDLLTRFPRSIIAVYVNSAKGELNPPDIPLSAYTHQVKPKTPPAPSSDPAPDEADSVVSNEPAATPEEPAAERPAAEEPAAEAPPPSWGIVTNDLSMALSPESGKPIRQLKAGDVLVIEGARSLQNMPMLTGTLILNNRNVPGLAFNGDDLEIRPGDFLEVPSSEVALRSRLAEIQIQENQLQPKVDAEEANLTPPEIDYRAAQNRMAAFQREAAALNAKLESTTGSDRMAILDKLRLMKYQEQTILRDLSKAKDALAILGSSNKKPRYEPQLTALLQEKKAILKRLSAPAP
ncbi:MAG: hypothetical protein R6X19_00055 [Kiritimatiellia bacterium]